MGTADHETDVLEQAADLVLEIALDLDPPGSPAARGRAPLAAPQCQGAAVDC
jgi:hypothetical protein